MENLINSKPTQFNKIVEMVQHLPKNQKQRLVNILVSNGIEISESQKRIVRNRIKYYNENPHELVSETVAWQMIDG